MSNQQRRTYESEQVSRNLEHGRLVCTQHISAIKANFNKVLTITRLIRVNRHVEQIHLPDHCIPLNYVRQLLSPRRYAPDQDINFGGINDFWVGVFTGNQSVLD